MLIRFSIQSQGGRDWSSCSSLENEKNSQVLIIQVFFVLNSLTSSLELDISKILSFNFLFSSWRESMILLGQVLRGDFEADRLYADFLCKFMFFSLNLNISVCLWEIIPSNCFICYQRSLFLFFRNQFSYKILIFAYFSVSTFFCHSVNSSITFDSKLALESFILSLFLQYVSSPAKFYNLAFRSWIQSSFWVSFCFSSQSAQSFS